MNYYRSNKVGSQTLENTDQLIAEDVEKFTSTLSEVYSNTLKPIVDFILFSMSLKRLLGTRGPMGMYSWFIFAALIGARIIPSYGKLAAREQQLEGYFRNKHARVINNSEMIAFMGGEIPEKNILNKTFQDIRKYLIFSNNTRFFSNSVMGYVNKYGASAFGFILVVLPVYWKETNMATASAAQIAEFYVESRQIMEGLADAVVRLFDVQKEIGRLSGLTDRVWTLLSRLTYQEKLSLPSDPEYPPQILPGDELSFDNVSVYKPDGTLLVYRLTFKVPIGKRVMITGENGCGKSSLFRVLRGLWPLASGTITAPDHEGSFYFLSQVNFVPIGSLRDIIIYPDQPSDFKRKGKTDKDLLKIMKWSHLQNLECNGIIPTLDTVLDWDVALSPGQKQRMAFARLLYHHPTYAVLDECTNGIAPDVEKDLYHRLSKLGISVFSISHKTELKEIHDYEIHFNGDEEGSYEYKKLGDRKE